MNDTTKYPDLLGFQPGSPWQLAAELRGASHVTNLEGHPIPYADLMNEAADAMDTLLVALKAETTIRSIDVWAVVNPEGRFTLSCVYKDEEEARTDRKFWLEECGWRLVPMQVKER